MKVNSNVMSAAQHVALSSQNNLELSQHDKAEKLNNIKTLPTDVYHQDSLQDPKPTYDRPVSISSNEEAVTKSLDKALDDIALATVHLYTPSGTLSQSVNKMSKQFEGIMSDLHKQLPQLANTDWGIAITESGELHVTGSLTDDERTLVEKALNSNDEFVAAANDFKSSYLKYIDMEVRGWAKYDVNEDNFSQIFDLKDILDSSKSDEHFKKEWGYESNWMKLHENISQQLSSKASKY